jgi:hypothetical protein
MKHVKKKYVSATKLGDDVIQVINNARVNDEKIAELQKTNFANHYAHIQTDENYLIQTFQYNELNIPFFIPEPNPIVIYFETARFNIKNVLLARKKLFLEIQQVDKTLNNFFLFYQNATIVATFLFNSIEAFVNGLLPHDFIYKRTSERKTECYDRFQIQSSISFEEKIKSIIPQITNKSFQVDHGHKYESIKKLKDFRDSIMHTKPEKGRQQKFYKELYTLALDFKYEETIRHVKDFLNYYEDNLIEECDCGNIGAD